MALRHPNSVLVKVLPRKRIDFGHGNELGGSVYILEDSGQRGRRAQGTGEATHFYVDGVSTQRWQHR